ncbi:hypothetical protein BDR07DRAFT_1390950 [Suillus spraguei]|nr:hypothetical protein BDR07DRAFT_1390950 [Suillus spraguei]
MRARLKRSQPSHYAVPVSWFTSINTYLRLPSKCFKFFNVHGKYSTLPITAIPRAASVNLFRAMRVLDRCLALWHLGTMILHMMGLSHRLTGLCATQHSRAAPPPHYSCDSA